MGKEALCWIALAWLSTHAPGAAAAKRPLEEQVRYVLEVQGTIHVDAQGAVASYELQPADALDGPVRGFIDQAVQAWRFEPTQHEGRPAPAKAAMHLRLVATPAPNGAMEMQIASAAFGSSYDTSDEEVTALSLQAPDYPPRLNRAGVQGTVYLLLRIDRSGHVADAAAQEVDLRKLGTPVDQQRWRTWLADASLEAARRWTFRIPVRGEEAAKDSWVVQVPVEYLFDDAKPGRWEACLPGPVTLPAWAPDAPSPGAVAAGEVFQPGTGLRLLTPVGG